MGGGEGVAFKFFVLSDSEVFKGALPFRYISASCC